MKKLRFIFVFIFLTGMLYTVFQYVPILEEESQNHGTELAKKNTEDSTSGNDTDESDTDGDDAINHTWGFYFTALHSQKKSIISNKNDYNSFFQKINVPPPKA